MLLATNSAIVVIKTDFVIKYLRLNRFGVALVRNLPWSVSIFKADLCNNSNRIKALLMEAPLVSKYVGEAIPIFQAFVDCFMSCSSLLFCSVIWPRYVIDWCAHTIRFASVAKVCFNHFISSKHTLQIPPKDLQIRPSTTWKRTINPHNISCLNTNCNFVSKPCFFEFVWIPFRTKWLWLLNPAIRPIHCYLARFRWVTSEPVIPNNLTCSKWNRMSVN